MPSPTEPVRRLDTTSARNGPIAQPREAIAYAMPNSTIDAAEPVRRGARSPLPGTGSDRPASSQAPATASPAPRTTVSHGRRGCTCPARGASTRPKAPKTATYPRVSAAVQRSARPTAAAVAPGVSGRLRSPATSTERYAGSSANPHGLTAPSIPAVKASSSGACTSHATSDLILVGRSTASR